MFSRIEWGVKLILSDRKYYRVKAGQTLGEIAAAFSVAPAKLARVNGLSEEVREGQVLLLPEGGNRYVVTGGESRTLLAGSEAAFHEKNGTKALYIGQIVIL